MKKATVRTGWWGEGRTGKVLGDNVFVGQWWTPVLWDGDEDPDWFKTDGLFIEEVEDSTKSPSLDL